MFGLLNVHKPAGMTSRDVINRIKPLVAPSKIGHAGTLDPLATGVLLVTIGQATRLEEYLHRLPKHYRATFLLGRTSDTEDVEGTVQELPSAPVPGADELQHVLPRFIGPIDQMPPAYSALKVAGRRAYDLAREGKDVSLAPRRIHVHSIELIRYEYPELQLDVLCGSGTYIRSLGRDIARALGTEAIMSALVRTVIGPFDIARSVTLPSLNANSLPGMLLPPQQALTLPQITLTPEQLKRVASGLAIEWPVEDSAPEMAALDELGNLVAILKPRGPGCLTPDRYFPPSAPAALQ